jgi:hypothetical protein
MANSNIAITGGNVDTYQLGAGDHRQIVMVGDHGGYEGRATSFITPGRAGTTGQKLMSIHNATGSTIAVDVNMIAVDIYQTVIKAVTVPPPLIRVSKFTALHTGGNAITKVAVDSGAPATSSSVTVLGDASANLTSSTTALAFTPTGGLTQEFAPRLITAAGYEMLDRTVFLDSGGPVTLRALEGVGVELIYTAATQNPITDMWSVNMKWEEYTP